MLLRWLKEKAPEVYQAIEKFEGGSGDRAMVANVIRSSLVTACTEERTGAVRLRRGRKESAGELALVGEGRRNKQIADLPIHSVGTVRNISQRF